MTARARFTQAELTRAIRAAEACGKLAVLTPQGIAFVESGSVALPSPEREPLTGGNSCDKAFGT